MYLDLITTQVKYEVGTNSNKDINDTYKKANMKKRDLSIHMLRPVQRGHLRSGSVICLELRLFFTLKYL